MFWNKYELLCKKIGKSPNAFAKEIGAGTSACTYWKNGAIPKGETLLRIADNFNCSIDYLLGRTDNPQAHEGISVELSGDKQELLELFDRLSEKEQGIIIGEMRQMSREQAEAKKEEIA